MYVCVHPWKKENPRTKVTLCMCSCSHTVRELFLLCVPSVLPDLFLPHQIFSVKSDIWDRENHNTAMHSVALWKGQLSLTECVRPADTLRERRERGFFWTIGPARFGCIYTVDSWFVLTWFGQSLVILPLCCSVLCWTELLSSVLNCSAACCNLFSAWPDYCLLHIVWWPAAGWRDGRRRGEREGGMEEALICCYIRKITFLLMYPSGRVLYLVVCPVYLFVRKPYEISLWINQNWD